MRRSRFSGSRSPRPERSGVGFPTEVLVRRHRTSRNTFYNWKRKYCGLEVSDTKKLRQIQDENNHLKKLVSDLSLDNEAPKASETRTLTPAMRTWSMSGMIWGGEGRVASSGVH